MGMDMCAGMHQLCVCRYDMCADMFVDMFVGVFVNICIVLCVDTHIDGSTCVCMCE